MRLERGFGSDVCHVNDSAGSDMLSSVHDKLERRRGGLRYDKVINSNDLRAVVMLRIQLL